MRSHAVMIVAIALSANAASRSRRSRIFIYPPDERSEQWLVRWVLGRPLRPRRKMNNVRFAALRRERGRYGSHGEMTWTLIHAWTRDSFARRPAVSAPVRVISYALSVRATLLSCVCAAIRRRSGHCTATLGVSFELAFSACTASLTSNGEATRSITSLELGGAPEDIRNVWPEPRDEAKRKDEIEDALVSGACYRHRFTLGVAQASIARNWTATPVGLPAIRAHR